MEVITDKQKEGVGFRKSNKAPEMLIKFQHISSILAICRKNAVQQLQVIFTPLLESLNPIIKAHRAFL